MSCSTAHVTLWDAMLTWVSMGIVSMAIVSSEGAGSCGKLWDVMFTRMFAAHHLLWLYVLLARMSATGSTSCAA